MARFRCRSCLGTYQNPAADGVSYFHRCAPILNPAWAAQVAVNADGSESPRPNFDPTVHRTIMRANFRDENVTRNARGEVVAKAEGLGKDTL